MYIYAGDMGLMEDGDDSNAQKVLLNRVPIAKKDLLLSVRIHNIALIVSVKKQSL